MALSNAYCTLADVKAALRIADTLDDALLETAINSASRLIDGYCNRSFYQGTNASEVRYFGTSDPFMVWIDDLVSLVSLETASQNSNVFDTVWSNSGTNAEYELLPKNSLSNGFYSPYTGIKAVGAKIFPTYNEAALIRVTGRFGWSAVPDVVKQACILQSARLFKRLESPLGVAGVSDLGIMRVTRSIDGDVAQLIDPFRQMRING